MENDNKGIIFLNIDYNSYILYKKIISFIFIIFMSYFLLIGESILFQKIIYIYIIYYTKKLGSLLVKEKMPYLFLILFPKYNFIYNNYKYKFYIFKKLK